MLDVKLIQSCLDHLDCAGIEYDVRRLKAYQRNFEPEPDEEEWELPFTANVIIWLDGQKRGEPGRYADFSAHNYSILDWQLYLRDEEGKEKVLLDTTDWIDETDYSLDWDSRYDD